MASHPKLIIIGIDSATWDLMDPWLAEGELPNIASVVRHGGRSELRSVVPPITGCAWPTIMTGTNPGRHGMFGFATYEDGYAPRPISNRDRRAPALWEMLNHHGLTVGVYNVPMTYPCDDVDGYMVSGEMGAVEYGPSMFRPRHLFDELRRAVPRYELAPVVRGMREEDGVERLAAQVEARRKAAAYLLEKHPTDVFIAVVNYVDHVQHRFMTTRSFADIDDMVLWAYRRADEFVGEVLSHAGEDTAVMILSDHGAGPLSGFVDPDALLHQLGYRSYRTPPIWERPLRPLIRNARKLYARLLKPHLSKRHQRRIRRGVPRTAGERKPDWTRSRAYAVGPYLCLRLNLQGREASGSVPAADRQRLRDELVAELNEVTNPFSGQRDLNVHPAEEYYSGEYTDLGPDIVALPQNFALETVHIAGNIDQPFLEREQIPPRFDGKRMLEGTHRMNGVLAVRTGRSDPRIAGTPHLTDVAPTALALLSLPIPSGLDGGVVLDIPHTIAEGEAPTRTGPERQSSPGYSEDEARQVEQRLRDLGYM